LVATISNIAHYTHFSMHSCEFFGLDYYWYTFTMPEEPKKLQIGQQTQNYSSVYVGSCDSLIYLGGGYRDTFTIREVYPGEQVFIRFEPHQDDPSDWSLSLIDLEPGDNCSSSAEALVGINHIPLSAYHYYRYTYIMPQNGYVQITHETNAEVYAYLDNCRNTQGERWHDNNKVLTTDYLQSGEELYITWLFWNNSDFDWELNLIDSRNDIDENPVNLSFELFPNPVSGVLNLQAGTTPLHQIALYTPEGRLLQHFDPKSRELNLQHIEAGLYLLQVNSQTGSATYKILKE